MIRPERTEILNHIKGYLEYLNADELYAVEDTLDDAWDTLNEKGEALRKIIFNTGQKMENLN